jgi:hypothetical protein
VQVEEAEEAMPGFTEREKNWRENQRVMKKPRRENIAQTTNKNCVDRGHLSKSAVQTFARLKMVGNDKENDITVEGKK